MKQRYEERGRVVDSFDGDRECDPNETGTKVTFCRTERFLRRQYSIMEC